MNTKTKELVQLIAWHASENEKHLTNIRIVKFLYLLDLFYARSNQGRTLTGWPWRFIHYGPYCGEASEVIESAVKERMIEANPYQSKYSEEDRFLYDCKEEREPNIANLLSIEVLSELKAAINRWADDTAGLLDYVYFSTEPMQNAVPGSLLDFKKAHPIIRSQPINMKKLPPKQISRAKEIIRALSQRYEKSQKALKHINSQAIIDKAYYQALSLLDDPDLETGLTGQAKLDKV